MPERADGDMLFDLVDRYWAFGIHRTGTEVDHRTAAWMGDELTARGLRVEPEVLPFDRWSAESTLTADGRAVDHLAVPYEWEGTLDTRSVVVLDSDDPHSGGRPDVLAEPIAQARAAGADALVVPTVHPEGSLRAVNRDPAGLASGFPVVLVAGRDAERVRDADLRLSVVASTTPATTTNVVARNGVAGRPLILTTPLTGWFGCAGERGTGIAVLLHLVDVLRDLPLVVNATGGHELTWFGAQRWVEANQATGAAAVVHVGASAAVVEPGEGPDRELISTRVARTSLSSPRAATMSEALASVGLDLRCDSASWLGEAQSFCHLGIPLLSFTGAGRDFHCPEDTPSRATTPEALARIATAFEAAARELYRAATS
ncbi:MAG: hypothetical protein AAF480_12390 [Actinomycetota bacterium]